jgi:hypothetical protein
MVHLEEWFNMMQGTVYSKHKWRMLFKPWAVRAVISNARRIYREMSAPDYYHDFENVKKSNGIYKLYRAHWLNMLNGDGEYLKWLIFTKHNRRAVARHIYLHPEEPIYSKQRINV